MNITAIHLYSVLDNPIAPEVKHAEFNLVNTSGSDSYIIKGMSGLDVDEVIHRYYATNTVGKYHNIYMQPRTVVFSIRLNPQYQYSETTESLRNDLQKMISYTRSGLIEMRFMSGETHVSSLFGLLTKFESALFTSDPEVQITFRCEQPLFVAPERVLVSVAGARTDFKSWTDNLSTAAHGFKMQITFPNKATNFVDITTTNTGGSVSHFSFILDMPFNNSVLYFSSETNDRYLYVLSGGNIFNLGNEIEPYSVWPIMHPGTTRLDIDTNPLATNDFVFSSISYVPTYWGI